VHVFDQDTRKYYQLEELWADGKLMRIDEGKFMEKKKVKNG
jgi:ribosomal silencing factor RsfS